MTPTQGTTRKTATDNGRDGDGDGLVLNRARSDVSRDAQEPARSDPARAARAQCSHQL